MEYGHIPVSGVDMILFWGIYNLSDWHKVRGEALHTPLTGLLFNLTWFYKQLNFTYKFNYYKFYDLLNKIQFPRILAKSFIMSIVSINTI
jgi:hypothetical protein